MADTFRPWREPDDRMELETIEATVAQPTTVFTVHRSSGRGWMKKIFPAAHSLNAAKERIDSNRITGSTWTIIDEPAITFVAGAMVLIVAESDATAPLSQCGFRRTQPTTLSSLAKFFQPTAQRRYQRYVADAANLTYGMASPCYIHNSESYGGHQMLAWRRDAVERSFTGILEVIALFQPT